MNKQNLLLAVLCVLLAITAVMGIVLVSLGGDTSKDTEPPVTDAPDTQESEDETPSVIFKSNLEE